jgi:hypothetical protein
MAIGGLDIALLERSVTGAEFLLGNDEILLAARDFPIGCILEGHGGFSRRPRMGKRAHA